MIVHFSVRSRATFNTYGIGFRQRACFVNSHHTQIVRPARLVAFRDPTADRSEQEAALLSEIMYSRCSGSNGCDFSGSAKVAKTQRKILRRHIFCVSSAMWRLDAHNGAVLPMTRTFSDRPPFRTVVSDVRSWPSAISRCSRLPLARLTLKLPARSVTVDVNQRVDLAVGGNRSGSGRRSVWVPYSSSHLRRMSVSLGIGRSRRGCAHLPAADVNRLRLSPRRCTPANSERRAPLRIHSTANACRLTVRQRETLLTITHTSMDGGFMPQPTDRGRGH